MMKFHKSVTIGGMLLAPGVAFSVTRSAGATPYEVLAVMSVGELVVIFLSLGTTWLFKMKNGETTGPPRTGSVERRPRGRLRYTVRR